SENCMIQIPSNITNKERERKYPAASLRRPSATVLVELLQETQIAFVEQAQIVDSVTQHRQALEAGAEREANELLGIETHVAQHRRMHLTGTRNLEPAPLERTAAEGNVDLGRRFGKRKIRRTEAHLQIVGLEE